MCPFFVTVYFPFFLTPASTDALCILFSERQLSRSSSPTLPPSPSSSPSLNTFLLPPTHSSPFSAFSPPSSSLDSPAHLQPILPRRPSSTTRFKSRTSPLRPSSPQESTLQGTQLEESLLLNSESSSSYLLPRLLLRPRGRASFRRSSLREEEERGFQTSLRGD